MVSYSRPDDSFVSPAAEQGTSRHIVSLVFDKEPPTSSEASSISTSRVSFSSEIAPQSSAVGKLRENIDFWKDVLRPGGFILDTIERGLISDTVCVRTDTLFFRNNASSLAQGDFVRSEIEDLLAKGYVQETSLPAYCCESSTEILLSITCTGPLLQSRCRENT